MKPSMIGVIVGLEVSLEEAIKIANKTERACWLLVRKLGWSKGRIIYWLRA